MRSRRFKTQEHQDQDVLPMCQYSLVCMQLWPSSGSLSDCLSNWFMSRTWLSTIHMSLSQPNYAVDMPIGQAQELSSWSPHSYYSVNNPLPSLYRGIRIVTQPYTVGNYGSGATNRPLRESSESLMGPLMALQRKETWWADTGTLLSASQTPQGCWK